MRYGCYLQVRITQKIAVIANVSGLGPHIHTNSRETKLDHFPYASQTQSVSYGCYLQVRITQKIAAIAIHFKCRATHSYQQKKYQAR